MPSFVGGRGAAGAGKTKFVIAMILIAVFFTVMNLHATIKHGKEFDYFSPSDMLILDTSHPFPVVTRLSLINFSLRFYFCIKASFPLLVILLA